MGLIKIFALIMLCITVWKPVIAVADNEDIYTENIYKKISEASDFIRKNEKIYSSEELSAINQAVNVSREESNSMTLSIDENSMFTNIGTKLEAWRLIMGRYCDAIGEERIKNSYCRWLAKLNKEESEKNKKEEKAKIERTRLLNLKSIYLSILSDVVIKERKLAKKEKSNINALRILSAVRSGLKVGLEEAYRDSDSTGKFEIAVENARYVMAILSASGDME